MGDDVVRILQSSRSGGTLADDAILTTVAAEFDGDLEAALQLARRLEVIIDAVPIAVGLAAPQIGIRRRVAVVKLGDNAIYLIDPTVLEASGKRDRKRESCLSVWGLAGEVERREKVLVRSLDPEGRYVERQYRSFEARAVQHEVDHLNGTLYTSRAHGGLFEAQLYEGHSPTVLLAGG